MAYGGKSYNGNVQTKKAGIMTNFVCKYCGRRYKQDYTKSNHEKNCSLNDILSLPKGRSFQ